MLVEVCPATNKLSMSVKRASIERESFGRGFKPTNNVTDKVAVNIILLKDYKVMFATTELVISTAALYIVI